MSAPEHFHESDPTGLLTLERFAAATHFNKWLFDTIRPYCKGHVLEVGSGIGNISKLFLGQHFQLTASDLRAEYCEHLVKHFGQHNRLEGVVSIDLVAPDFSNRYSGFLQQFDTVVASNVIEHIKHDHLAVSNCLQLLRPGGHLVILVPAYQSLYNKFDEELGHYRRYTASTVRQLLEGSGLSVIHQQYFNIIGILGWFIDGSVLKKRLIPRKQLMIFDSLMPLIRLVDTLAFRSFGLSTIAVGRKPQ